MKIRILCLFVLAFLSGCTTTRTAFVSGARDPGSTLTEKDSVGVLVNDASPIEERRLGPLIEASLRRRGISVVNPFDADYLVLYSEDEKTLSWTSSYPLSTPSTTTGVIGGVPYTQTTTSTTYVPITSNYTAHKIYIRIYRKDDVINKKYKTVWEGYIGCSKEEWNKVPDLVLDTLFQSYPGEYNANVQILKSRMIPKPESAGSK